MKQRGTSVMTLPTCLASLVLPSVKIRLTNRPLLKKGRGTEREREREPVGPFPRSNRYHSCGFHIRTAAARDLHLKDGGGGEGEVFHTYFLSY